MGNGFSTAMDTLQVIKGRRFDGPRRLDLPLTKDELEVRLLSAWCGRVVGCMLESADTTVMATGVSEISKLISALPNEHLDDTILSLITLEKYGPDVTTRNIADMWLHFLDERLRSGAEHTAYRNLVSGAQPSQSAVAENPFREWNGAHKRADIFGYVCPGNPELAAEMAHRDAIISHSGNGIYSSMFVAALISAAFSLHDIESAIRVAYSEIPSDCGLAEMVHTILKWRVLDYKWSDMLLLFREKWGGLHARHSIHSLGRVVLALLQGDGDLIQSIRLLVDSGVAIDAGLATVGSVCGAMEGSTQWLKRWIGVVNRDVPTGLRGQDKLSLPDLAERTRDVCLSIQASYAD
ncbi:ADP-ribosylglycohydrolase family protein [Alicyclobacillus sp. SO9]|uniref:ADP-ribosylglycohydrolase family protein n=1 Tax=Alicyclobacillus sp. SO9 TaxID=2665646 RepID=UPI0018E7F9E3|nr:ADP-ribosylglycohydrolase family protein [Alicyclobacillus sp. SO9]QQE80542.1 ADP-ribosylglycohydrolase family protein [Alicyclobacillus sp. SO9]